MKEEKKVKKQHIMRQYRNDGDEFEISKKNIIHTRVLDNQILEVWYLEKS